MEMSTLERTVDPINGLRLEARVTDIREIAAMIGPGLFEGLGYPVFPYLCLYLQHKEPTNLVPNQHYPTCLELHPLWERILGARELYAAFRDKDDLTLKVSAKRLSPENWLLNRLHRLNERMFGKVYEFRGQFCFGSTPCFDVSFTYTPHSFFAQINTLQPVS